MQNLKPILAYVNPVYCYYVIFYYVSLFLAPILGIESVWQVCWNTIRKCLGDDIDVYTVWFMNIYTIAIYWIFGLAIIAMEKFEIPKNYKSYQIRTKPSEIEQGDNYYKVTRDVLRNQMLAFAVSVLINKFDKNSLGLKITPEVPSFYITMRDLMICLLLQETLFYYCHRTLHHRKFYWLHKKHHEFTSPASITAEYCGVTEHFVCNLFPVVIGLKILGSHYTTALLFWTSIIITTLIDHSGYNLLHFHSPEVHMHHHTKFNVNYASKFLSQLNGTYYEESVKKEKVDS
ncbi:hypothetical protein ACKWTF_005385 [Chironomus riparius]